ncbi:MAG: hypothetical protein EB034_18610 [Verrucomicrobia bacterium]|nr:hypothetical protein [Verrucomicrobiota bacterium]
MIPPGGGSLSQLKWARFCATVCPSAVNPTALSVNPLAALTEGQRAALLTLLTDEDPAIYQVIRAKIIEFGAPLDRIIGTINYYLFHDLGFSGNESAYYDPDNSYLNRVVDRRTGNPISLCVVYLAVAKRLQLPITGIGMPGHFVCRLQTSRGEVYIDPFRKGKLMTKGDCIKFLINSGHDFHDGFLAPVTPRRILLRICSNLHNIYTNLNLPDETLRFQRYIVALSK